MSLVTDSEWEEYKNKFDKTYEEEAEDKMRRELFAKAKAIVDEHNRKYEAGEVTWKMGINHLSDLTEEEYAMRCGKKIAPPKAT